MDVSHKQNLIIAYLKELLSKPDLKTRDVLTAVGKIVADRALSPFDAAKYLADLPSGDASSLQLRQWVAQHYATASKSHADRPFDDRRARRHGAPAGCGLLLKCHNPGFRRWRPRLR